MKKLSVILTTYNAEAFLQRTLDSIFGQDGLGTAFELELIVVDDFSTDGTAWILEANGVKFVTPPFKAGGPNVGRNIGLRQATGDYICIMDHDDEWHPRKTISQLPLLEKAPIVSCGYTIVDTSTGKKIPRINKPNENQSFIYYPQNVAFIQRLTKALHGQQIYLAGVIYSAAFKHIEFEEYFRLSDFDWFLRLLHQQSSAEVCESLYTRHVAGSNLSLNNRYVIQDFYFSLLSIEAYARDYPHEVKTSYQRIHGTRARYHYICGEMQQARFYFCRAGWNWKTVLYYLTTFIGSEWVKKRFNVFG